MEVRDLPRSERDDRVRVRLVMLGHMLEGMVPEAAAGAVGLRRASGYIWARRDEADRVAGSRDRPSLESE